MELSPGSVIDAKYEIVRLLGEGGMGAVFEGRNRLIERRVAIKVLHASARMAEGVVERFEREARAAGRIGGDHILEVLDLGSLPNGDRYMVMEFLDGETLSSRIQRMARMTPEQFAPLLRQALVGLSAVHAAGIVHRDLKPDNLFILREKAGRRDFLKIIDFGVSKFGSTGGDMSMTRTGSVMGTPYYMSPEQAKGAANVNLQSDLYSMGVITFEALTGSVPFDGTSFNDLMFKIVLSEMPSLEEVIPGVDAGFASIVRRATAKDLNLRYQSAADFLADVDAWARKRGLRFSGTLSVNPTSETIVSAAISAPAPAATSKNASTKSEWARTGSDADIPGRPKSRVVNWVVGSVIALSVAAAAAFAVRGSAKEQQQELEGVSSATAAPSATKPSEPSLAEPAPPPQPAIAQPSVPPDLKEPPEPTVAPEKKDDETKHVEKASPQPAPARSAAAARRSSTKPSVTSADATRAMIAPEPPPSTPPETRAEPAAKKPAEPAPKPSRPAAPAGRDFGY